VAILSALRIPSLIIPFRVKVVPTCSSSLEKIAKLTDELDGLNKDTLAKGKAILREPRVARLHYSVQLTHRP
jgi:hypothetical protein